MPEEHPADHAACEREAEKRKQDQLKPGLFGLGRGAVSGHGWSSNIRFGFKVRGGVGGHMNKVPI